MIKLEKLLPDFGADVSSFYSFGLDCPELLPYATLTNTSQDHNTLLKKIAGVYEWQDYPLMFLVDAELLNDNNEIHQIRRLLAMRGDAPYLGIIAPGRLEVYKISLDNLPLSHSRIVADINDKSLIPFLSNNRPNAAITHRGWISNVVLNLLTSTITKLIELKNISDEDAISLVGRALFIRFLADRNLLPENINSHAASLFDNSESTQEICIWLDKTFNGDLLPLSENIFNRLPEVAYHVLGDVLRRAPNSQLFLGWEEKWDYLDFAHIPVGVLSQAYELYLRNHAPERQRKEGGFYTPRPIADLMVRSCLAALSIEEKAYNAKILDPSAGAGVFLLTAFRELVAERWKHDRVRPCTQTLREILYNQIVGFDINEAALRFSALGLYLMSIELDAEPKPVDKLKFKNLRDNVLLKMTTEEKIPGQNLGSLGVLVGEEHINKYDLVIGNPPWSSGTKLEDWEIVRSKVSQIAQKRGICNTTPPLPNEVLDLPFVWRAMEWAKPNAQITFALHARLLFQQGDGMSFARQALFDALNITSVINGVELRQTKVWPEISAPFCIIIANNKPSAGGSGFCLINPRLEQTLNSAGSMRIDTSNADIIPTQQLLQIPDIIKILFRGTKADLSLVTRIRSKGLPTLEEYWKKSIGVSDRGRLLGSGSGYQTLKPSSRIRKNGDGLPGVDASYLKGYPELSASSFTRLFIDTEQLDLFKSDRIHDPRSLEIFKGPIAIIHKSPPASTGRINVALAEGDIVFNETFYGYSPIGHKHGKELATFITLILGSRIALWFVLVTSGEFGFEREVVEKTTVDRLPIPDFDSLSDEERNNILTIYELIRCEKITWDDIDDWVANLYGFNERDLQVINDTLEYNLPFSENKKKAQALPNDSDIQNFCEVLTQELTPWTKRFNTQLSVKSVDLQCYLPWQGILVSTNDDTVDILPNDLLGLINFSNNSAASEVIVHISSNQIYIGRLAQKRYWSKTQARLLAQRIIWSYLGVLKGENKNEH